MLKMKKLSAIDAVMEISRKFWKPTEEILEIPKGLITQLISVFHRMSH